MACSYRTLPPCGKSSRAHVLVSTTVLAGGLTLGALLLGGCSLTEPDDFPTGSPGPFATGVDPKPGTLAATDIAAIGAALATTRPVVGSEALWENPVTGSAGRVTEVVRVPAPDGRECRAFATTVNGLGGLSALSGIGCRTDAQDQFTIEGLAPKA